MFLKSGYVPVCLSVDDIPKKTIDFNCSKYLGIGPPREYPGRLAECYITSQFMLEPVPVRLLALAPPPLATQLETSLGVAAVVNSVHRSI